MKKHPRLNLFVSNESRIYRMDGIEKALKKFPSGYPYVRVKMNGKTFGVSAHIVVWETLKGPIPIGKQINHKDGDKTNYHIKNLEILTPSENVLHAYKNNLSFQKLTHQQRKQIFNRYKKNKNLTQKALAFEFGVSQKAISKIINSKSFVNLID